ncbi:MAG: LacI family DNA-binding transcriptional regulator [Eubacteriales bacterium]|nr:LacI family DNA-binding transcriptional regulator [Eubacteriales bacterium]MDD3881023.1 LacI family DNA-binding transcriptional regulator [Eubacteriales bacterium]MDD4511908.1 LacI family DNA-binding transcriptional regulator [Eubacteriales bacterium]
MKATIKDVARAAGVSPSTVSRVASGSARISESTKKRVKAVMQELNYKPNLLARSLVRQDSCAIAVVYDCYTKGYSQDPFFMEAMRGICQAAQEQSLHVLISTGADGRKGSGIASLSQSGMVRGMILLSAPVDDIPAEALREAGLPFVEIGHPSDRSGNWVDNDNVLAGREATETLIRKGHKRIAFVGADGSYHYTMERLTGYREALRKANLPIDESLIIPAAGVGDKASEDSCIKRLCGEKAPSASVCATDDLAVWLIGTLTKHGIDVPLTMSVIGFNNSPMSRYIVPSLSTVDINAFELGRKACDMLIDIMENPDSEVKNEIIKTTIIERDSTAGSVKGR